jgi:hypothetical protein
VNTPKAARILADAYPQIVGFNDHGMTQELVHWHLGESGAIALQQYRRLIGGAR